MAYDRNIIDIQAWQQQIMNLHDKVDALELRSTTLVTVVQMLEERAIDWRMQIDTEKGEATQLKLTRFLGVALKQLAHYSALSEETTIEYMIQKLSLDSERKACAALMAANEAMHRDECAQGSQAVEQSAQGAQSVENAQAQFDYDDIEDSQ